MLNVVSCRFPDNSHSKINFETNTAVNTLATRPITSVTAKPFTGPVPKMNSTAQETTVVTWVSMMVGQSFAEPCLDGSHYRFTAPQLLANAFEDEDVAVHRHTDSQNHTGNSRQRQHCFKVAEGRDQDNGVQNQSQSRIDAAAAIIQQHRKHNRTHAHHARQQPLTNGIGSQRGPHGPLFQIDQARRQRTGTQHSARSDASC
jgi:hypothetical protein